MIEHNCNIRTNKRSNECQRIECDPLFEQVTAEIAITSVIAIRASHVCEFNVYRIANAITRSLKTHNSLN